MPTEAKRVRLFLLGGIELKELDASKSDEILTHPKLTALLALLALAPDSRMLRRDRLVGLLWPDQDQPHARSALRKALHGIRAALGADVLRARGDEEVGLESSAIWCDAVELVQATDADQLVHAVELYKGDLMPGFHLPDCAEFDRWLEDQRGILRERAAAATWALASKFEHDQRLSDAGLLARRVVRYSWDDERILRRAMAMLDRLGDRAGALALYHEFVQRMRIELDATPSTETAALAETLRT